MILTYNEFDGKNLEEEIEKIKASDLVNVRISTKDKGLLFLLGILFAAGKKINIINKEELDLTSVPKSFYIMSYVWELLGNNNFPEPDFFKKEQSDLNKLIENVKRLGLRVNPIERKEHEDRIFLISPVREMSKEQEKEIELHMKEMLDSGYKIHVPHLHTVQKDLFGGYAICYENASAIASSSAVHIYYDKQSRGSMFDLGVAYYLNKELVLVNEDQITFDNNDFGDNIVRNWNKKGMVKTYR